MNATTDPTSLASLLTEAAAYLAECSDGCVEMSLTIRAGDGLAAVSMEYTNRDGSTDRGYTLVDLDRLAASPAPTAALRRTLHTVALEAGLTPPPITFPKLPPAA